MVQRAAPIDKRLSYRLATSGAVAILVLEGEVDAYTVSKAHRLVDTVMAEGLHCVVLDASHIRYIDSAGAGFLVATWHRLKAVEGGMKLAACSGPVRRLVRILHLGLLMEIHEEVQAAIDAFSAQIERQIDHWKVLLGDAEFPDVRAKLGEAYLARGLPVEAEFHFRRALEVNDRYLGACLGLAEVLRGQARDEEAAVYLRRALEIAPEHPKATARLGLVTRDPDALAKALKLLRKELRANPRFADIHNSLGEVLLALDRLEPSREAFRAALRLNDAYVQARINIARVLLRLGHKVQARQELAKIPAGPLAGHLAMQLHTLQGSMGT